MGSDFSRFGEPTTSAEDKQRVVDTTDGKNDDTITFNDASYYNGPQPSKTQGPKTIHQKLLDILYSKQFQIIVIVLVIVDCILVVGELILDFSTLEEGQCPEPNKTESASSGHHGITTPDPHHPSSNNEEYDHSNSVENKQTAVEVLHYMSLTILSIFMLELTFKLIALRMEFFHHKLEVFDAIVIVTSFILDIVVLVYEEELVALELLVILRLWRIVRVVNGVIISVETNAEKHIAHHKEIEHLMEEEMERFRQHCEAQEKEIEILREALTKNNIPIDESKIPQSKKPTGLIDRSKMMTEVNELNEIIGKVNEIGHPHNNDTNLSNLSRDDEKTNHAEVSSVTTSPTINGQNEDAKEGSEC